MGTVISVYTKEAFKEYILPSINNADYILLLSKDLLHRRKDLKLCLENIDEHWRLKKETNYSLKRNGSEYNGEFLEDGDFIAVTVKNDCCINLMVSEVSSTLRPYKKYDLSKLQRISIGKSPDNDIQYDYQGMVSKVHAVFKRESQDWVIEDRSENGIYVNAAIIKSRHVLRFGDYINILGLHLVFLGELLAVDKKKNLSVQKKFQIEAMYSRWHRQEHPENSFEKLPSKETFHRSPRSIGKIESGIIEIEAPPSPVQSKRQPLYMTIGPAFTMSLPMFMGCLLMVFGNRMSGGPSGVFMYSGLIMALTSSIIGVIWSLINIRYQKQMEREQELHRFDAYSEYLIKKADEIKGKYEHNSKILHQMYPETSVCAGYDKDSHELWNRNSRHEDFLSFRLGIGERPFQMEIAVPKERFTLIKDALDHKPEFIRKNYETIYQVPICLDLRMHPLVGIIGGKKKQGAMELVKNLMVQIAANTCYTDVKIAYVCDREKTGWQNISEMIKWLPHTWSEDKKVRYFAEGKTEASDVFYELTKILRQRAKNSRNDQIRYLPHLILFVENMELLENEPITKYISDTGDYGFSTILLAETYEELPNFCEYIVQNDSEFQGAYDVAAEKEEHKKIMFDNISTNDAVIFAKRLANLEVQEMELGGEIANELTFFDMYHIHNLQELNIKERWRKNRTYDTMRVLIGEKAGGAPCYLDVHEKYHGPHGLVAGTTGSGKSETLQTYLLSLAVNFSPDDIGFFIIDYKGAGMANLFSGLPHMIGSISNLSGNQVNRAMVSIKSENRRRQKLFNEYSVNNINLYTKLYKNREASIPIPHLFIIIDEFAELKREEPNFMKELISVAQVGRSLGVHLILATQKPGGTVDDNIWSNSKFRLCLRVQNKQDSMDMLHKPDAIYINQAGRAYLEVGNDEVYEYFQSGWSGAPYDEDIQEGGAAIASLITNTGREDIIGNHTRIMNRERRYFQWLKCLEHAMQQALQTQEVNLTECISDKAKGKAVIQEIYRILATDKRDYSENNYNTARLKEFMQLYEEKQEGSGDVLRAVLEAAVQKNRKLPQEKEKTQLDAVKEYLMAIAVEQGYTRTHQLWMPVLPQELYLEDFEEVCSDRFSNETWKERTEPWSITAVIGKIDDPVNQAQIPLELSFDRDGHHVICGSAASGKSTFLQTLIFALSLKYSPQYLNFYLIDFSSKMLSAFEELPHVGGMMYDGDTDRIAKCFTMLHTMLRERRVLLRGGSYSQYIQAHGVTLPAILLVIDNYGAFHEKTNGKFDDMVVTIANEGVNHGIYLVLTGSGFGISDIPRAVKKNIKTILCLEMADKSSYGDILQTLQIQVFPETGVKGRGIAPCAGRILEFQTALALRAKDDYERMEYIAAQCSILSRAWKGKRARSIPEIPEPPVWSKFQELDEVEKMAGNARYLPVGYCMLDASAYGVDLFQNYCYLISGAARTGKKNFMKVMIQSAKLKKSQICIMDGTGRDFVRYKENKDISYVTNDDEIFRFFQELSPVFVQRNQIKNQMLDQGYEETEIFERMVKEKPVFIFIHTMNWFLKTIYTSKYDMKGFLETIWSKGKFHNIYFISTMELEDYAENKAYKAFGCYTGYRTGIQFGGKSASNPYLNYESANYNELQKPEKPGIGQPSMEIGETVIQRIRIPLAGK